MITAISLARSSLSVPLVVGALALSSCLVLGGGTRSGFLSDAISQLMSVVLLVVILTRWRRYENGSPGVAGALAIAIGLIVLFLLQLIPLPPELWSRLPGRERIVESLTALNRELPWMPLSVAPHATLLAA